jgi:hypothetical protein
MKLKSLIVFNHIFFVSTFSKYSFINLLFHQPSKKILEGQISSFKISFKSITTQSNQISKNSFFSSTKKSFSSNLFIISGLVKFSSFDFIKETKSCIQTVNKSSQVILPDF